MWRDSSTGINPFLPACRKSYKDPSFIDKLSGPLLTILGVFRLVMLAIVCILDLIISFSLGYLLSWETMSRINVLFGEVMIRLLGYSTIEEKTCVAQYSKDFNGETQLRIGRYKAHSEHDKVRPGDLVIANHSSYIDLVYLRLKYNAMFTKGSFYPPHIVYESSLSECLTFQDSNVSEAELKQRKVLTDLLNEAKRPIVVFPEGTRTNGRALIKFVADISALLPSQRIHVLSLRHDNFVNGTISPCFPVYSPIHLIQHVWDMCCQRNNVLHVKHFPPTSFYTSNTPDPSEKEFRPFLESLLLEATPHVRPVSFNMVDKLAFLRAFKK